MYIFVQKMLLNVDKWCKNSICFVYYIFCYIKKVLSIFNVLSRCIQCHSNIRQLINCTGLKRIRWLVVVIYMIAFTSTDFFIRQIDRYKKKYVMRDSFIYVDIILLKLFNNVECYVTIIETEFFSRLVYLCQHEINSVVRCSFPVSWPQN